MNNTIKTLQKVFQEWENKSSEEEIKVHVIINTFLPQMGYDSSKCHLEKNTGNGFCDIFVPINEETKLPIEVKNGSDPLKVKDIEQIRRYSVRLRQKYAMLTNGRQYMLLNFNIESRPITEENILNTYIVFNFDIFKNKGKNITPLYLFDYLCLEKLYNTQTTNFFSDITQYRVWKTESGLSTVSWWAYQCTLYNFYHYISNKYHKYNLTYARITDEDFYEFIQHCKRHGSNTSIKTIENNYTHIVDMLSSLKRNQKIQHHNFNPQRKVGLTKFSETEKKKTPTPITSTEIKKALEMYSKKRNATRNIIAFLMCTILGMERSEIINVTWDQFDKNFFHISLYGRRIELPNLIRHYLLLLKKQQKRKNGHIFMGNYNGRYKQINDSAINDALSQLKGLKDFTLDCSPQHLRFCFILSMFYAGYTLEDIMYVTNIDMKNLANYITMDMIVDRHNKKINWSKLYDGILVK